jgi:hypothetical protein
MYNYKQIDEFLSNYAKIEGSLIFQISEGVLGSGNWVCTAPNKKTAIIKEVFVTSWSSTHTIRYYNKTPKKYLKLIQES